MNLYVNFAKKCFNPKSNRLCFHTENHVNTGEKKKDEQISGGDDISVPMLRKG